MINVKRIMQIDIFSLRNNRTRLNVSDQQLLLSSLFLVDRKSTFSRILCNFIRFLVEVNILVNWFSYKFSMNIKVYVK
jgi:hypothetical protein